MKLKIKYLLLFLFIPIAHSLSAQVKMDSVFVDGRCMMCKDRIEETALKVSGIQSAEWDKKSKTLFIKYNVETYDENDLHLSISGVGHDTDRYLAPDEVYNALFDCCKYRPDISKSSKKGSRQMSVDGVCGMCKNRIETAALEVTGVLSADWDIATRTLHYEIDDNKFDETTLHLAISNVGHDTERFYAPDEIYENIHECCKYRDPMVRADHSIPDTRTIMVDGACEMCKDRIEETAIEVKGVKSASWDKKTKQLFFIVEGEDFIEDDLHLAISGVGHDTEKFLAPDEVYNELFECCKYREINARLHGANHENTDLLKGRIKVEENGEEIALPGVNVQWLGDTYGTTTNEIGEFAIKKSGKSNQLIVSYVGYYTDTLNINNENNIDLVLTAGSTIETVEVTYRKKSIEVSIINPILVQEISSQELLKAACCTLAESFETNPTVDVSFTDAVTGARQIQMLGLAGPYVQISRENIPDVRGLASIYGLVFIPGPWVESIQLAKGPGSVINGYESMTGQINVELKKPDEGERFYLNLYGNEGSRLEGNANARINVSDEVSTSVMVNGNYQPAKNDRNGDGFLDMPTGEEFTILNRWKYNGKSGLKSQVGIKISSLNKTSGQIQSVQNPGSNDLWSAFMNTDRIEGWMKMGKVFNSDPDKSIGFMLSATSHKQDALFGDRVFNADQQSIYSNFIFRSKLLNERHTINTGLSFQWDKFEEDIIDSKFSRDEKVPGAFIEYTYKPNDKFTAVGGLRGDHHSQFGFFLTPRLHLRYAPSEFTVIRFSSGIGRRTASIFAENIGVFASSRRIIVDGIDNTPYGLNQEVAWNSGLSWRQTIVAGGRELVLTVDAFHTRFSKQVVVDYDENPQEAHFYNLDGSSYSNNFQAQVDYALIRNFDVRLAYRLSDVQVDYRTAQLERPFVAQHRAFINLGYKTDNGWAFDYTLNWQGSKRIPSTLSNPELFQMDDRSPNFVVSNAQVSKSWNGVFDVYLGGENLFNFRQENPILSANDPFSDYFDSSLIWGPIFGRMIYSGIRYTFQ